MCKMETNFGTIKLLLVDVITATENPSKTLRLALLPSVRVRGSAMSPEGKMKDLLCHTQPLLNRMAPVS